MAGIYLHIPFCRKACHYCNFHFSTNLKTIEDVTQALLNEITSRKGYFNQEKITTLYFGGGTPSILSEKQMFSIYEALNLNFDLSHLEEVTIEINPEDVSLEKLALWKSLGINRLSIGVQSFFEEDLKYMNRNHDAKQSEKAIKMSQDSGFDNITIDLIFGAHTCSDNMWSANLDKLINLEINHASIYGLTVEENTALSHFINSGKLSDIDEGKSSRQFGMTMDVLPNFGYEQYEISNYAKKGFRSKHNSSYWHGKTYLGLGPSAHSYDGKDRFWSVKNNAKYVAQSKVGSFQYELDQLDRNDRFNEAIMTGLRLKEGLDLEAISIRFPEYLDDLLSGAKEHHLRGNLKMSDKSIQLTTQGKYICDVIAADLFQL